MKAFSEYKEHNLFLRGIVSSISLQTNTVYYKRAGRFAEKSKYPLRKMVHFAIAGITSFSIKPIRLVFGLGAAIAIVSYAFVIKPLNKSSPGWTFLFCSIWFLRGIQMISLGIIGEYIGKIYSETKGRPRLSRPTIHKFIAIIICFFHALLFWLNPASISFFFREKLFKNSFLQKVLKDFSASYSLRFYLEPLLFLDSIQFIRWILQDTGRGAKHTCNLFEPSTRLRRFIELNTEFRLQSNTAYNNSLTSAHIWLYFYQICFHELLHVRNPQRLSFVSASSADYLDSHKRNEDSNGFFFF